MSKPKATSLRRYASIALMICIALGTAGCENGYIFGPDDGIAYDPASGGYCDAYGCPDDYYDLPIYYGPIYYDGVWHDGPLYYRGDSGHKEYWVNGGWHSDQWHGEHPNWYSDDYYTGHARGRDFYANQFQVVGGQSGVNRGGATSPLTARQYRSGSVSSNTNRGGTSSFSRGNSRGGGGGGGGGFRASGGSGGSSGSSRGSSGSSSGSSSRTR